MAADFARTFRLRKVELGIGGSFVKGAGGKTSDVAGDGARRMSQLGMYVGAGRVSALRSSGLRFPLPGRLQLWDQTTAWSPKVGLFQSSETEEPDDS